jgi:hypothetical protein
VYSFLVAAFFCLANRILLILLLGLLLVQQNVHAGDSLIQDSGAWLLGGLDHAAIRGYDLHDLLPKPQFFPELDLPDKWNSSAPRLLPLANFSYQMIGNLKQQILLELIELRAEQAVLADPLTQINNGDTRGKGAKCLSLMWRVTGQQKYLEQALRYLKAIPPPAKLSGPEGSRDSDWGDWIEAAGVMRHYCVAYDLIRDTMSADDQHQIEQKLAAMANQMQRWILLAGSNNHASIIGTALVTCALTVSHLDTRISHPQEWLTAGVAAIRRGLAVLDDDGSYREGPYYAEFLARDLIPTLVYIEQALGVNAFRGRGIAQWVQWMEDLRRPDGSAPLVDDGWLENNVWPLLICGRHPLGAEVLWKFEENFIPGNFLPNMVEVFLAMRMQKPQKPARPSTIAYPRSGSAVLRSSWNSNAIYSLMQAEPRDRFSMYHEHSDPLAVTISAYGENLLVAPGYGKRGSRNPDHSALTVATAQNIPLINGRGPDPNPVHGDPEGATGLIVIDSPDLDRAKARYHTNETLVERDLLLIADRMIIVVDHVKSALDVSVQLGQRWRGRGKWIRQSDRHGYWQQNDVALSLHSLDSVPPRITNRRERGSRDWFSWEEQNIVQLETRDSQSPTIVSLFIPNSKNEEQLRLVEWPLKGKGRAWVIYADNGMGWILRGDPKSVIQVKAPDWLSNVGPISEFADSLNLDANGLFVSWLNVHGVCSTYSTGLRDTKTPCEKSSCIIRISDTAGYYQLSELQNNVTENMSPNIAETQLIESTGGIRPAGVRLHKEADYDELAALRTMSLRGDPDGLVDKELELSADHEMRYQIVKHAQNWLDGEYNADSTSENSAFGRRMRLVCGLLVQQYDAGGIAQLRLPFRWQRSMYYKGAFEYDISSWISNNEARLNYAHLEHRQRSIKQQLTFEQLQEDELHTRYEIENQSHYATIAYHCQPGDNSYDLAFEKFVNSNVSRVSIEGQASTGSYSTVFGKSSGNYQLSLKAGESTPGNRVLGINASRKLGFAHYRLEAWMNEELSRTNWWSSGVALLKWNSRIDLSLTHRNGDTSPGIYIEPHYRWGSGRVHLSGRDLDQGSAGFTFFSRKQRFRFGAYLQNKRQRLVRNEYVEWLVHRNSATGAQISDEIGVSQYYGVAEQSRHRLRVLRMWQSSPRLRLSIGLISNLPIYDLNDCGILVGAGFSGQTLESEFDYRQIRSNERSVNWRLHFLQAELSAAGHWQAEDFVYWVLRLSNASGQAIEYGRNGSVDAAWLKGSVSWSW